MSDFATKLDLLRRRRGLSVRALAKALDVGVGTVGGWLKEHQPRPEVAKRLADYFDVAVEDLLDDERSLPEPNRKEAAIEALPPDSKWHDLSKAEKQRLVSAVLLDSKQVQDLLQMLPQLKQAVAVLEAMAKPPDLDAIDRDLKQAEQKLKKAASPGQKHRPA